MKNAINWFNIPISDYDRAKSFYETILDIQLMDFDMDGSKMAFFPADEDGVGGSLSESQGQFSPLVNDNVSIYLNAPNLQESLNKVDSAGGKLIMDKTMISPDFGFFGLIVDTEGNKIGLHAPN